MTDRKYRDSSRGKSTQKGNRGRGGFSGRGSSYRRGGTDTYRCGNDGARFRSI